MSLTSAMQVARTGLVASQVGIQVAGNNLSNAATQGYSRQTLHLAPARDALSGTFSLGRGVGIRAVRRQVDDALQARLREAQSNERAAAESRRVLDQLESVLGELSSFDLSSQISSFFNTWSEASNLSQSDAVVVEQGERLASFITGLRGDLAQQRAGLEAQITDRVRAADAILSEIASVNGEIAGTEVGGATANALRDRRDELLGELAGLMDIDTVEDERGIVDVFIAGQPVVLAGESLGISVERDSDGTTATTRVVAARDGSTLNVRGGAVGGLLESRGGTIDDVIDRLESLAQRVIFEVNRVHATATDAGGLTATRGEVRVPGADRTRALNDPGNATFAGLPGSAENGGFFVNVRNASTGVSQQVRIDVDLDGIDNGFALGTADDTSVQDIVDALNAIPGLSAGFDAAGRVSVSAAPGFSFDFEADSSGVLAVLGVNSFFTGNGASDMAVREDLSADPSLLTLGGMVDGQFVENATALAVVSLQESAQASLGGVSFREFWLEAVQDVANEAGSAATRAESSGLVRENLQAQRDSVSGVSVDEESINLLTFQRQFQGSAQVISVANEMLDALIAVI